MSHLNPARSSPKTRVYIVDGYALIRSGISTLINAQPDMQVCGEAADASTAFNGIMRAEPDLVTVELTLNGNGGLELIKSIKAFNPKIGILIVSMCAESIYAIRGLKAGAHGFVAKQDALQKVVDAIRCIRADRLYVSDEIKDEMLTQVVRGQRSDAASPVAELSDRELEIGNLIGAGLSTREIAERLCVSVKTVETHQAHLKRKLGLPNSTKLRRFWVCWVERHLETRSPAHDGFRPVQQPNSTAVEACA
jgi:DNA-binding NarL/FixJ family response regulator